MAPSHEFAPGLVHEPSLVQKIQEKMAASRFLTFSVLFHIIVVTLAGGYVVMKQIAPPPDFTASEGPIVAIDPIDERPKVFVDTKPEEDVFRQPQVDIPERIFSLTKNPENPTVPLAPSPQMSMPTDKFKGSPTLNQKPNTKFLGANGIPESMAQRFDGTKRMEIMKMLGGKEKSEQAVLKGLRWLAKNQNEDGSWSPAFAPSMTGLAVLCFLGHGETPASPEFGPVVKKGIDWIMTKGTQFEGRLSMTKQFTQSGVYEHAICAYALGEYYSMTKDDRVKDVLTQAIAYIVDGQAPDGGWQYAYAKGPDSDTSVTGWQIQALKAAHLSGLSLPGVEAALDKAIIDLRRVNGPNGGFGYRTPADSYSLTGAGVLCTYFWKGEKDKVVKDGIKFIIDETEKRYPVDYQGASCNLYAWYYHTQACLMVGGPAWTKWNKWFQDPIVDAQSADGSWPAVAAKAAGPQGDAIGAGPFYRTTLCVLMLEVYYRYMPINSAPPTGAGKGLSL